MCFLCPRCSGLVNFCVPLRIIRILCSWEVTFYKCHRSSGLVVLKPFSYPSLIFMYFVCVSPYTQEECLFSLRLLFSRPALHPSPFAVMCVGGLFFWFIFIGLLRAAFQRPAIMVSSSFSLGPSSLSAPPGAAAAQTSGSFILPCGPGILCPASFHVFFLSLFG